ncbi:hypothetical protein GUJ93_ZPchr0001g29968 [Zizania palustris]|uniref:glucan endo-1,3-beta-D-glucosidase n=1 Tax=Zizania palustris TaxID=103762 RepID=A0A8J5RNF8_ZIZPA|nr:hypothetical protein GUJ93_ZPchr0001g29968 [Zizania palustris]
MFDLWKLHSWAGGVTEFADGRNQESTSEAVNAYYSAALLGLSYGDTHLVSTGATLTAFEMLAAQTWWHIREGQDMYEYDFSGNNCVVGVLWANKRDSGLWFAPPEWKECRLGIQLLPILPISKALFPDISFVKEIVDWTIPALSREGVGEGWKGFVYALEGIYDKKCLGHVLLTPGGVNLGKHSNGIQEVPQMVVLIIENAKAEVGARVPHPLQCDKAAPFGIIQEAIALEAAVQPWRDGSLQEPLHRRNGVRAANLLRD